VAAAVVDFLVAFLLLLALMVYYGIWPGWGILLFPLLLALAVVAAVGVGTLLAALNVSYRDFKYTIPFLMQIWMFATPTVYMNVEVTQPAAIRTPQQASASLHSESNATSAAVANPPGTVARMNNAMVPDWIKAALRLNPMTGLIGFFRAAVLGGPLPWASLGNATMIIGIVFVAGLMYFRRVESNFADII
jgi:lipopolysaccharide transport system permease protein